MSKQATAKAAKAKQAEAAKEKKESREVVTLDSIRDLRTRDRAQEVLEERIVLKRRADQLKQECAEKDGELQELLRKGGLWSGEVAIEHEGWRATPMVGLTRKQLNKKKLNVEMLKVLESRQVKRIIEASTTESAVADHLRVQEVGEQGGEEDE